MSPDDVAPEHDPLSEEMDLITFQEADARLFKERAKVRSLIAQMSASEAPDSAEIEALQRRLEAMERVMTRLRAQRTQPPLR